MTFASALFRADDEALIKRFHESIETKRLDFAEESPFASSQKYAKYGILIQNVKNSLSSERKPSEWFPHLYSQEHGADMILLKSVVEIMDLKNDDLINFKLEDVGKTEYSNQIFKSLNSLKYALIFLIDYDYGGMFMMSTIMSAVMPGIAIPGRDDAQKALLIGFFKELQDFKIAEPHPQKTEKILKIFQEELSLK